MDNQDPATLSDEQLEQALDEVGLPSPPQPKEELEPDNPTPPKQEDPAPEAEPVDPAEAPKEETPSKREQLRVQQLLARYGHPQASPPSAPPSQPPAAPVDFSQELEADPETIKRFQADRQAATEGAYERGRQESRQESQNILFHTRLEIDSPKMEAKHPVLDQTSDKFDPVLADAINTMYLDAVGYNPGDPQKGIPESVQRPNLRYSEYIEGIFELGQAIGKQEVAVAKKNITRQAAQTGLRPDGSKAKKLDLTKPPHLMTDEELDAVIAQAIPPR